MIRPPPRSTRTDTLFPYTTLFRSQRVVIADAVRVVTDAVARGFVVPRFNRVGDGHADAAAKVGKTFFGDLGKAIGTVSHGHSPGNLSIGCRCRGFAITQHLAVNLAGRGDRKSTRLNSSH